MRAKKTFNANLERRRSVFIGIGLVVAIGVVLGAFSVTTRVKAADLVGDNYLEVDDDILIPITEVKTPPPPPPPPPKTIEILTIVDDLAEIEDPLEMEESEVDLNEIILADIPVVEEVIDDGIIEPVAFAEEMPEFPGGIKNLMKFLAKNVKYPTIALENGVHEKVYIQFVVEKDGSVSEAKVLRGEDPALTKEALRVVNLLPKWKPGRQRGEAIRCYYQVPVNFTIQ